MPRHARNTLADLVDGSHYESLEKVIEYVHKYQERHNLPPSSDKDIETELNDKKLLRGRRGQGDVRHHYFHPIYANHFHQYQVDLLQQSHVKKEETTDDEPEGPTTEGGKTYPKFFFMAINTNTRYAYAFPIDGKDTANVLGALQMLKTATHDKLRSIVCDEEAAITSAEARQWLKDNHVGVHFIPDQNHTALGVIDRLIRTIRDMNIPTRYSTQTSTHRKYRDLTNARMQHLLQIYNDNKHSGTGFAPNEMQGNEELETRHIIRRLYFVERRKKITNFNLKVGRWVRYIIPRDPMKKARYKISTERYQVSAISGNAYEIMAGDGTTMQIARWRLIPLKDHGKERWKVGTTFKKGQGQVLEVIGRREGKGHQVEYKVKWQAPIGVANAVTWVTRADLRKYQPDKSIETPEEKAFNDAHTRRARR
jgi:hypothetical protein